MNALTLESPLLDPLGVCLDPSVCTINHSCSPNAFVVFDGPRVSVRVLTAIRADEEIFISYIDTSAIYEQRQSDLQSKYRFICHCTKCLAESSTSASIPGQMSDQMRAHSRLTASRKAFDAQEKVALLNQALGLCTRHTDWPEHSWPLPSIRQAIADVCRQPGLWYHGFKQCMKLYLQVFPDLYPQEHHPDRVVATWTFAKLALHLVSEPEVIKATRDLTARGFSMSLVSWGLVRKVEQNVDKSHGSESGFARIVKHNYKDATTSITQMDSRLAEQLDAAVLQQWSLLGEIIRGPELDSSINIDGI